MGQAINGKQITRHKPKTSLKKGIERTIWKSPALDFMTVNFRYQLVWVAILDG